MSLCLASLHPPTSTSRYNNNSNAILKVVVLSLDGRKNGQGEWYND